MSNESQLVVRKLWPHQLEIANKFERLEGVLAGWAMGTGKTLYAIERDLRMRAIYDKAGAPSRTLIVTPSAVHPNWLEALQTETVNYFGDQPRIMHMNPKKRDLFFEPGYDYYLMHWEALRFLVEKKSRRTVPIQAIKELGFTNVVLDEIHRIKNWQTKKPVAVVVAAKHLEIRVKTGLSGTLVPNKPQDLWSPLNYMYPRAFPAFWPFADQFIEQRTEDDWGNPLPYRQLLGPTPLWEEHREALIGGFTSIISDDQLPYLKIPKANPIKLEVDLAPKQRKAYVAMEDEMLAWVDNGMEGIPEDSPLAVNAVIAKLIRLQQFAIGSMVHVGFDPKTGKPLFKMDMPSAKLEAIKGFTADTDESFVIFSQFSDPLELLAKLMPDDVTLYTGKNRKDRDANLARFKAGNQKILGMTYGAGGEGIDGLQHVCRNVILIDRHWVPDTNNQAIGRVRRAGQKYPVNVIDIVAKGTLDDGRNSRIFTKGIVNRRMLGLS